MPLHCFKAHHYAALNATLRLFNPRTALYCEAEGPSKHSSTPSLPAWTMICTHQPTPTHHPFPVTHFLPSSTRRPPLTTLQPHPSGIRKASQTWSSLSAYGGQLRWKLPPQCRSWRWPYVHWMQRYDKKPWGSRTARSTTSTWKLLSPGRVRRGGERMLARSTWCCSPERYRRVCCLGKCSCFAAFNFTRAST